MVGCSPTTRRQAAADSRTYIGLAEALLLQTTRNRRTMQYVSDAEQQAHNCAPAHTMFSDNAVRKLLPMTQAKPTKLASILGQPASTAPAQMRKIDASVDIGWRRRKSTNSTAITNATDVRRRHRNMGTSMARMPYRPHATFATLMTMRLPALQTVQRKRVRNRSSARGVRPNLTVQQQPQQREVRT